MVWWIAVGVVVLALAILVVVAVGTAGRTRGLERAARAAQDREPQVAALQERVAGMQETLASLATRAEVTQERIGAIQDARRDGGPDGGQRAAKQTMATALRRPRRHSGG